MLTGNRACLAYSWRFLSLHVAMDVPQSLTLAVEFGCSNGTHALIGKVSLISCLDPPGHMKLCKTVVTDSSASNISSGKCHTWGCCRYEEERLPRVKTLHMKGTDGSSPEEKEKYMYKPTFKPLWCKQVH